MKNNSGRPNRFICPHKDCNGTYAYVIETEVIPSGIKRVRRCTKCDRLFDTFEKPLTIPDKSEK